jgi:hypothetical protein
MLNSLSVVAGNREPGFSDRQASPATDAGPSSNNHRVGSPVLFASASCAVGGRWGLEVNSRPYHHHAEAGASRY